MESRVGVVAEAAVGRAEIAKRKAIQVRAMCGIAKRAEICVMRGDDDDAGGRRGETVKLFDGANDVREVLDDVNGTNLAEAAVAKGIWKAIEIRDDIGIRVRVAIKTDSAGIFIQPAADIENRQRRYGA